jgi:predicted PhzF superfamily epimerase YddE/YHI9
LAIPILVVDAFTGEPFKGNPAAVCLLPASRDEEWMQAVAAEMNLSETAFLQREGEVWRLRWFTPTVEVDLCGHATLASAHVLLEEDGNVRFLTRSGELTATRLGSWIELDFPSLPAEAAPTPAGLAEALGVEPVHVGKSRFDYIVEVADEETVRALRVDIDRLRRVEARGVIVTSRGEEYDFVSRFFAPRAGVDEDPVTGSAHCCLAPWWAERLGKEEMTGYQASRRGGVVQVKLEGDRVLLRGQAVTVLQGALSS